MNYVIVKVFNYFADTMTDFLFNETTLRIVCAVAGVAFYSWLFSVIERKWSTPSDPRARLPYKIGKFIGSRWPLR